MVAPLSLRAPANVRALALLVSLLAFASARRTAPSTTRPAPTPRASEVQAATPPRAPALDIALALHLPASITLLRAQVLDHTKQVTATCHSAGACARLERWATHPGKYVLELDYRAASGEQKSFEAIFIAGYGETSIEVTIYPDSEGALDVALYDLIGAPIAGVELREVAPGQPGALPSLELFNGSNTPIYVRSQGSYALLQIADHPAGIKVPRYSACGTGGELTELAPGAAVPAKRLAAIGAVPPLPGGRYRVAVKYGPNEFQQLTSLRSREVSLEVEVKEAAASTAPAARSTSRDSSE